MTFGSLSFNFWTEICESHNESFVNICQVWIFISDIFKEQPIELCLLLQLSFLVGQTYRCTNLSAFPATDLAKLRFLFFIFFFFALKEKVRKCDAVADRNIPLAYIHGYISFSPR